jgi:hypothetical protein
MERSAASGSDCGGSAGATRFTPVALILFPEIL